ncbi:hypothetical protein BZA05DRAFT_419469 [Tricharina praecox]|uniref:uncharacterized protein n=1 Tax=Tricharina praecox TaxID=43433 RepID=UPI0022203291|nr:uncharacterized protein BZA05DRAFT_419469 [Tricharina praecox]KAI5850098.1 hypothetical protein BZA05DRAFT_419469 [Tricharina praecox]
MQNILLFAAAAFLTSTISVSAQEAQSPPNIPECAFSCILNGVNDSACSLEVKCLCESTSFVESVTKCVPDSCTPDDIPPVVAFANQQCEGSAEFPIMLESKRRRKRCF